MEKEFYTDEFEQLLKEKADQFRMYPSKRVWHSIYNNLHPSRRWPSVVMSLLLITSLSLIGYLNTGDNIINRPINNNGLNEKVKEINIAQNTKSEKLISSYSNTLHKPVTVYDKAFADIFTQETDFYPYTVVKNNRPDHFYIPVEANTADSKFTAEKKPAEKNSKDDIIRDIDLYIKSNKIFTDLAIATKKNNAAPLNNTVKNSTALPSSLDNTGEGLITAKSVTPIKAITAEPGNAEVSNTINDDKTANDKKPIPSINVIEEKKRLSNEEKAWIENYASMNKPALNKWKDHVSFQFYATPAVNYRKLSTKSKGSVTPFANADINEVISQKPGFGMEAGVGLTYSFTKNLLLKAGFQFNYTNYNIDADETTHPVLTTILLNDPNTGVSYAAARTSTTANSYNTTALKPVTLHNRTYQISLPVGLYYKLSSEQNVDWYAGASIQPTYVFGGNAHLISTDLKSYVSDPSSIRTWNLNLGFETFMNFKLGEYNLQVGPQVRYQVYSTYRRQVALIEKPYAVGLKLGLTKGF